MSYPRYAPGSHFESCPATTGQPVAEKQCSIYPDGAHRCRHDRHPTHYLHECLCKHGWVCVTAGDGEFSDEQLRLLVRPARHAA